MHQLIYRLLPALLLALLTCSAYAGTCTVPGDYASVGDAVSDLACTSIELASGRYAGQTLTRSIALIGAGTHSTVIEGEQGQPAISVQGNGVQVSLQGMRLESGNGSETVFQTDGGGEIVFASDIQIGLGNELFSNGFEDLNP